MQSNYYFVPSMEMRGGRPVKNIYLSKNFNDRDVVELVKEMYRETVNARYNIMFDDAITDSEAVHMNKKIHDGVMAYMRRNAPESVMINNYIVCKM